MQAVVLRVSRCSIRRTSLRSNICCTVPRAEAITKCRNTATVEQERGTNFFFLPRPFSTPRLPSHSCRFHFNSIGHDNTAFSSSIDIISSPFPLPSTISTSKQHLYATLEGTQTVSKFNKGEDEADLVKIFLAVIRVDLGPVSATAHDNASAAGSARRGGDITICVNVPLGKASKIDKDELGQPKLNDETRSLLLQAQEAFRNAVHDFTVVDYGLFA